MKITQANYMEFLGKIDKDPRKNILEFSLVLKYLKRDFPKTYMESAKRFMPNACRFKFSKKNACQVSALESEATKARNTKKREKKERAQSQFVPREMSITLPDGKYLSGSQRRRDLALLIRVHGTNKQVLRELAEKSLKINLREFKSDEDLYRYVYDLKSESSRTCIHCGKKIKFKGLCSGYDGVYCSDICQHLFKKMKKQFMGHGSMVFPEYRRKVRDISEKNAHKIPDSKKRGNHFRLDHKVSIASCFKQGIYPEIAGSEFNLRVISADENVNKSTENSITARWLLEEYRRENDTKIEVIHSQMNFENL